MTLPPKVYQLLGDGGYVFSLGFAEYGIYLGSLGLEVHPYPDSGRDVTAICVDIMHQPADRKIALIGYSLGANGCAWVSHALEPMGRAIDLIVAFDPTKNGPPLSDYPIGPHVKRAICFQQTSWLSPISWFFGRSVLVPSMSGPEIEVHRVSNDHLALQFDPNLQNICTQAILELKEKS